MLALDIFPQIDFAVVIITTKLITAKIITTKIIITTKLITAKIITTKIIAAKIIITTKIIGDSPEIMDIDVTDTIEEAVNTINVR
jgi:hypothetical protein